MLCTWSSWHYDQTCEDYDDILAINNDMATIDYKRRNTKACPNCEAEIEKSGGCDHMTCPASSGGCGFEFCWRCLEDYSDIRVFGNHFHKCTCRYYVPYDPYSDEDSDTDEEIYRRMEIQEFRRYNEDTDEDADTYEGTDTEDAEEDAGTNEESDEEEIKEDTDHDDDNDVCFC